MASDVKWIKITTDIFDDEKVLMIESMPSADSIIVIWFKLLVLAGKQNNSGVFILNNRIAYTDEMLASIFRRDIGLVRMALRTFEQFDMIERHFQKKEFPVCLQQHMNAPRSFCLLMTLRSKCVLLLSTGILRFLVHSAEDLFFQNRRL